jgi:hypothetical protein
VRGLKEDIHLAKLLSDAAHVTPAIPLCQWWLDLPETNRNNNIRALLYLLVSPDKKYKPVLFRRDKTGMAAQTNEASTWGRMILGVEEFRISLFFVAVK